MNELRDWLGVDIAELSPSSPLKGRMGNQVVAIFFTDKDREDLFGGMVYCPWPGPQKGVRQWVLLDSGDLVGFNIRGLLRTFPLIKGSNRKAKDLIQRHAPSLFEQKGRQVTTTSAAKAPRRVYQPFGG